MKNIGLVSGNVDSTPHGSEPVEGSPEDESFRDAIPRLPRAEEYFTRGFAVFVLFYSTYWLIWRWTSTINPDAVVFSVALAIADTMGVVNFFLLVFTCWKLTYHQPPPAPRGIKVDVFITTYDEPLEVLRRTAIGARAIRYPHRTYMLDDGERDEVRAMCQQLGLGYIRRTTHEHAKAGPPSPTTSIHREWVSGLQRPFPAGSKVTLPLALASGTVQVSGEVLRVSSQETQGQTVYLHGVRFDQLPFETRDAIELHCAHHSIPMLRMQYRQSTNLFTRAVEVFGNIRGERRYQVQLPAEVSVAAQGDDPAEAGLALLEDVSPRGARLLMETPVAPGRKISFEVPGTSFSGHGTVIFNRTLESPMRVRFVVGIIRDPKQSRFRTWTREWRAISQRPVDRQSAP